jgi:hypothetical protein
MYFHSYRRGGGTPARIGVLIRTTLRRLSTARGPSKAVTAVCGLTSADRASRICDECDGPSGDVVGRLRFEIHARLSSSTAINSSRRRPLSRMTIASRTISTATWSPAPMFASRSPLGMPKA